jgi:hypothetical protein
MYMAVYADEPGLTPGKGFFLESNGNWGVKDIPGNVVQEARFSGYLTINGYNCAVFEMPNEQMWAQKSNNTPADEDAKLAAIAVKIAAKKYPLEQLKEWENDGFFDNNGSKDAKRIIELAKIVERSKTANSDDDWVYYETWDELQSRAEQYIGFKFPEIFR